jgi:hypothetical protein
MEVNDPVQVLVLRGRDIVVERNYFGVVVAKQIGRALDYSPGFVDFVKDS